ncbi:pulmonary surfactant-associated protein A [Colius striatus]|uniref:pulmonary surfactant-associated protein A n=1 Tax=Colius striatus TaxID=57412 RepID=UPI002B1D5B01|nr:pulmonary surfactant-associated protein A [Colius striatus]
MLSPQLFHTILGAVFFLFPWCAQGKPAGSNALLDVLHLPKNGIAEGLREVFLPQAGNEMENVIHQLEHRISRLEGVLYLEKIITGSGGKIFATNGKRGDFRTTLKTCEEAGGSIAAPRNQGENDAILYFVKSFNTYAYLGIKESLIPSKFLFLDGTRLSYTNWHVNEPSGKGEEECVQMYTDGTWNDKRCNQNYLIVCQF